jgi:hypothetical protein
VIRPAQATERLSSNSKTTTGAQQQQETTATSRQQRVQQQQASQQQVKQQQALAAVQKTPIRYDAADARASAELSQSAQGREGWKAGPWNIRSSYRRRSSRNGAAAFG